MLRPVLLFIVIALVAPAKLHAQAVDSLWAVWNNTDLPDTARMQAMDYLTFDHYMYREPDTAYVLKPQQGLNHSRVFRLRRPCAAQPQRHYL